MVDVCYHQNIEGKVTNLEKRGKEGMGYDKL